MSGKSDYIPLTDLILLQRGFDLPERNRTQGAVPIVASTGIAGYHNEAKVNAPGVVIGRSGSIGGGQYLTEDFWPLNTTLWVKDFRGHNPKYIYYLLKNIDFKRFNAGSGVPTLNRNHLEVINVLKFNKSEEELIANSLGLLDNKIDLLRRQNETLEAIAQTLFKRWFVEFEFPDERGRPYKSSGGKMVSELGKIPEGWSEKSFYELGAYINGGAFKQEDFSQQNAGLPIIKIVELKYGITNQTKHTEKQVADKIIINDKDILFSWSGSPETSIDIFVWNLGRGVLNQHIFKVIPNKSIERTWLYNLLKFYKPLFIRIAKQKQTTGLGHVTVSDLRENKVVFPNNKILTKYNLSADPIFKKYYLNLKEINTLSKLRNILLPKLMSGQIRVK